MKINFLELNNFRNMKAEKLHFESKNFVVLIGDNGSGKTAILESITKAFVPVIRAVNGDAVKMRDLNNEDIQCGSSNTAITIGITLDGSDYVWTNRRRLSSTVPFDENIEQKQNDLKA